MLALIVLAPLAGALFNGVLNATGLWKRLSGKDPDPAVVAAAACVPVLVSALVSTRLFLGLLAQDPAGGAPVATELFSWIVSGSLEVGFGFLFDSLSAVMALVVTWVGFLIHVYSVGYMRGDSCLARYFAYLNLFVFFMLVLVLGDNFLMLFVGWEGVGLASYLLIGFWHRDSFRAYAGRKAFVVNRIGDLGFILGIFLVFTMFGSLDYREVFSLLADPAFASGVSASAATALALLLFVGAAGKSAQFPLHVWLPDAMAGPTAVSALIHAATMVTAGVYMMSRCAAIFSMSPAATDVVLATAAFTAFFAATVAVTQNDVKKVLAYSTVSQLGYMFMAAAVGAYAFAVFHLVTHAFFKALLFLGAGSVIHAASGEQDIRRMGGLRGAMPVTAATFLAGTLAICGFPLFSGFFSKDEILSALYHGDRGFFWVAGVVTAALTAFYMTRLYVLVFEGKSRMDPAARARAHESPPSMTVPLVVLALLSVFGGFLNVPAFMEGVFGSLRPGLLGEFLFSSIPPHGPEIAGELATGFGHWTLAGFSVLAAGAGMLAAAAAYSRGPGESTVPAKMSALRRGSRAGWYVDGIYEALFSAPFRRLSGIFSDFDRSVVDGAVDGAGGFVRKLSVRLGAFQTGFLRHYAAAMVGGVLAVAALVFLFRSAGM